MNKELMGALDEPERVFDKKDTALIRLAIEF